MKRVALLFAVTAISFGFMVNSTSRKNQFTIQELIKNPKFEVNIVSKGGHCGKCVGLEIISKTTKSIKVRIPAGTLFYPTDNDEQTLIAPKQEMFAVKKGKSNYFDLSGFCTESSDRSPKKEGEFKIGINKNKKLTKLLAFLKGNKKLKKSTIQEAIWCITNNNSIGNVYSANPEDVKELKKTLASITGREIPWQTTQRNIDVDERGYIVTTPVKVEGKIIFSTLKPTKVKSKIVDSTGNLVYEFTKPFNVPKVTNAKIGFKITVKGWDKGKYFVVYFTAEGKELVKQEFVV